MRSRWLCPLSMKTIAKLIGEAPTRSLPDPASKVGRDTFLQWLFVSPMCLPPSRQFENLIDCAPRNRMGFAEASAQ